MIILAEKLKKDQNAVTEIEVWNQVVAAIMKQL